MTGKENTMECSSREYYQINVTAHHAYSSHDSPHLKQQVTRTGYDDGPPGHLWDGFADQL
jgi:hypothetical protein